MIDWTEVQNTSPANPIDPLIDDEPRATQVYPITILRTDDTHAHLEPSEPFGEPVQGGVARHYNAIQQVKAEGSNVILVDAGDDFQGTLFFNVWAVSP